MAKTVIGMFKYKDDVEDAIDELKDLEYDPKDMSVIMKDVRESKEIQANTGTNVANGAATGAATGGVIGGLAGLLIGIGAITIPGLGALLVAGPIATALGLTGAAAATTTGVVTGMLAGGLLGALTGLGVPDEEARHYEEQIRAGGILLAVPTRNVRVGEVETIMTKYHATGVRQLDLPGNTERDEEYRHVTA